MLQSVYPSIYSQLLWGLTNSGRMGPLTFVTKMIIQERQFTFDDNLRVFLFLIRGYNVMFINIATMMTRRDVANVFCSMENFPIRTRKTYQ